VISVGSIDRNLGRSRFSQYNEQVELTAPGGEILSTVPGDKYDTWSGTSMAAPHVAAVAGLIWMYFPTCTNSHIRHVLAKTAKDLGRNGCDIEYGFGLVQARDAYDFLVADGNCGYNLGPNIPIGGCNELYPNVPSKPPTPQPTKSPTHFPTTYPTINPTHYPTNPPTKPPTFLPTISPYQKEIGPSNTSSSKKSRKRRRRERLHEPNR